MATFRPMPSGRTQAIIRKKGRKPISKTFPNKTLARTWATDVEAQLERGTYINVSRAEKVLLKELFDKYKNTITPNKKGHKQESSKLDVLSRRYGEYSLAQLDPEIIVDDVLDTLEEKSSETIRKEINLLNHVIKTARALWKYQIRENPVAVAKDILQVTNALQPSEPRVRRILEDEEQKIYEALTGEMKLIFPFAIETGMRRGEIAQLERSMRKEGRWDIPGSITKNGCPRSIPESDKAKAIYKECMPRIDRKVFNLKPDSISQAFGRVIKKLEIEDLHFHDTRHEAISRWFEEGLSITRGGKYKRPQNLESFTNICASPSRECS